MAGIRRKEQTVPRKIHLTQQTSARVDLFLADPTKRKPIYGGLSVLCEQLLIDYLNRVTLEEDEKGEQ